MSGIERERLLMWIIAWCGLSASWSLESHSPVAIPSAVAELAIAKLGQ